MIETSLRPLSLSDTANIVRWRNSDFVRKNLYTQDLLTEAQHTAYFERKIKPGLIRQFVITADDGADIGTVFFKNIDTHNQKAEVGIFIGESGYAGGGAGSSALRKSLIFAFDEMKLHKVYATIMENNTPSRKLFAKVGFVESGLLLDDFLADSGYINVVVVEMTEMIYQKRYQSSGCC